jgi:hypothetical protein
MWRSRKETGSTKDQEEQVSLTDTHRRTTLTLPHGLTAFYKASPLKDVLSSTNNTDPHHNTKGIEVKILGSLFGMLSQ